MNYVTTSDLADELKTQTTTIRYYALRYGIPFSTHAYGQKGKVVRYFTPQNAEKIKELFYKKK